MLSRWNSRVIFVASGFRGVALVSLGTAVLLLGTTNGILKRTAGILATHSAARAVVGTETIVRTDNVTQLSHCWEVSHHGSDRMLIIARPVLAGIALPTALSIATADGIFKWTTANASSLVYTARISFWAAMLLIATADAVL